MTNLELLLGIWRHMYLFSLHEIGHDPKVITSISVSVLLSPVYVGISIKSRKASPKLVSFCCVWKNHFVFSDNSHL